MLENMNPRADALTDTLTDVLTFGETMLRLSPPGRQRLGQAASLEVWVAGSESNVVAGLRVLGRSVSWASRLPDNPLGRRIESALLAAGIDVSSVVWTPPGERVGTFYAEAAAPPRAGAVVYDRAGSAASFLCPSDLPDALLDRHRHLHVSGITPALSPTCAEAVSDAVRRAKARGRTVSLDVNYRAKLWTREAASQTLSPLLSQVDVLFCSHADAGRLFGLSGDAANQASGLRGRFGVPAVAVTSGSDGAAGCDSGGVCLLPAVPVEATVERFGSGDAFAAGFLSEWLAGSPLERCLRLAVAVAALKRTIPGDMLAATRADVEAVLGEEGDPEAGAGWR